MRNIYRVPSVLILIIGLAILPSFYAWFNIKASWDPYSNTQGIKIGVVSDDAGTEVEGRSINLGDELVENLKDNDSLGWQFDESIEEADEKVYKGDYFATIHIPESFSEDVVSILNEEPRSAIVQYKVNEKINAIAPKMTSAGATQITETINDEFVQTTTKTMLETFNDIGIELEQNLPTLQKIKNAVYNLHDHIDDIDEAGKLIMELNDDRDTIKDYADKLDSLEDYEAKIREGGDYILTAQSHMGDIIRLGDAVIALNDAMPDIENALNRISSIQQYFPEINQGLEDAYTASIAAGDTLADVQSRIPEINEQINSYQQQVNDAQDAVDEAEKITGEISKVVQADIDDAERIINGLPSLDANESITPEFMHNMKDAIDDSQKALDNILDNVQNSDSLEPNESLEKLSSAADNTQKQGNELVSLLDGMQSKVEADSFTNEDADALNEAISNYQAAFDDVKEDLTNAEFVPKASHNENNDAAEKQQERDEEIDQVINELHADTVQAFDDISNVLDENINVAKSNIQSLPALIAMKENPDTEEYANEQINVVVESLKGLQSSISSTQDSLSLLEVPENKENLQKIKEVLENDGSTLNDLIDFLENSNFDLSQLDDIKDNALNHLDELQSFNKETLEPFVNNTFTTLENRLNDADSKLEAALAYTNLASDYLAQGAEIISDSQYYLGILNENLPYYEQQFSNVSDTVNQHFPDFKNGVGMASDFFKNDLPGLEEEVNSLAGFVNNDLNGLIEQYKNLNSLVQENLPDAQEVIAEMADFFKEDWPGYKKDIQNAYDRIKQMEDDQIIEELISALQNDLSDETEYFSRPVQLDEEKLFPIPNYGSANTPFYTVLALWVGALLLCNLITTDLKDKDRREQYTLRDIYLGRMVLFLIVAILQAIIVSLGNIFILHSYMAHPVYFTIFSVLIALCFMIIVYTLVSLFGNVGKAIAIILMILQLSGGGGMFPIQVAPAFFQAIHPFLPFTYAIDILREASGGIVWSVVYSRFLVLLIFPIIFILLGYTFRPWIAPRVHKAYLKSKESNLID